MNKEKVSVITEPGKSPRVFRSRKAGVDSLVGDKVLLPIHRQELGGYIEKRTNKVFHGRSVIEEVEISDDCPW